ncbi:hypothetical protein GCM10023205_32130 [Yinghuangia aomiensis]|uniref:Uncharacterized protein n=1 Tax=Yinghuangia aomiensis TaxID=676205 RepID=A0ABP9HA37_9ACTN
MSDAPEDAPQEVPEPDGAQADVEEPRRPAVQPDRAVAERGQQGAGLRGGVGFRSNEQIAAGVPDDPGAFNPLTDQDGELTAGFVPPVPFAGRRDIDGLFHPLGFQADDGPVSQFRPLAVTRTAPEREPLSFRPDRGFAAGFHADKGAPGKSAPTERPASPGARPTTSEPGKSRGSGTEIPPTIGFAGPPVENGAARENRASAVPVARATGTGEQRVGRKAGLEPKL